MFEWTPGNCFDFNARRLQEISVPARLRRKCLAVFFDIEPGSRHLGFLFSG